MTKEELKEFLNTIEGFTMLEELANDQELEFMPEADFSRIDLSNANLENADLITANLRYADLSEADLRDADLSSADLEDTKFNHTVKLVL